MNDMSARLDAYFDGELAAAEFALLEQWLAADSRHRALLVAHATEALVLHDALRGMETDVDLASLPPQAGRWRTLLGYVHNVTTLSWILSVLIVSIILLSLGLWTVPTGQPSLPGTERSQFVARIERTSGATWSDETDVETGKRTDLFIGQLLELRGGWAEIKFDRGARAVLTAPAVVRIRSDNSCDLLAGELTARADAAAEFTVETIAASIIDVGTEFGVAVSGAAVDAEVFDGEIIVRRNLDGATEQRRLVAGQAVRIALGGNSVMVDASAGKLKNFVQASFAGGLPEQLEPLPVTRSLALWLAADRGIRLDAAGGVITWRDTLGGDNKTAENAEQPLASKRPTWVAEGINGKPAVRFDGASSLQTPRIGLGNARTVFIVCRTARHHGQLLNFYGENNFVVGVSDTNVYARFYVMHDKLNTGVIEASEGVDDSVAISYSYDSEESRSSLHINGKQFANATASHDCTDDVELYIGTHPIQPQHLQGDVSEIVVFDDVLSTDEQSALFDYLLNKYSLDSGTATPR